MFHVEHCGGPDKRQPTLFHSLGQDRSEEWSSLSRLVPGDASHPATVIVCPVEVLFPSWLREVDGKQSAPTTVEPLAPLMVSFIAPVFWRPRFESGAHRGPRATPSLGWLGWVKSRINWEIYCERRSGNATRDTSKNMPTLNFTPKYWGYSKTISHS